MTGPAAAPGGPGSGDPMVDRELTRLDELDQLPVAAHPEVFRRVHERLRALLDGTGADGAATAQDRP